MSTSPSESRKRKSDDLAEVMEGPFNHTDAYRRAMDQWACVRTSINVTFNRLEPLNLDNYTEEEIHKALLKHPLFSKMKNCPFCGVEKSA